MLSELVGLVQNLGISQTWMDQRGRHMKINFDYFQIQNWMLQTVRAEEVDEKSGVICLVSIFPSCVMVFTLSKKVNLFQFCADLSKKPKSVKASYIYASESSHSTFLENNMVYRGRSNRFFFHLGFLSRPFTNYRTARKGKRIF